MYLANIRIRSRVLIQGRRPENHRRRLERRLPLATALLGPLGIYAPARAHVGLHLGGTRLQEGVVVSVAVSAVVQIEHGVPLGPL